MAAAEWIGVKLWSLGRGCCHYLPILSSCALRRGFTRFVVWAKFSSRVLGVFVQFGGFLESRLSRRIFTSAPLLGKCGDANSVFWRRKRSFGSSLIQFWTLSCRRFCPEIGWAETLFREKFLLLFPLEGGQMMLVQLCQVKYIVRDARLRKYIEHSFISCGHWLPLGIMWRWWTSW